MFDDNELDTRFIKANIQRYINREDMVIHEDKQMDFFYMEDLVNLVDYFLSCEEWVYEEVDCVYMDKPKLTDIAKIINSLSDYKVGVELGINKGNPYIGTWRGLPIRLVGLEKGIKNTYSRLKNEY